METNDLAGDAAPQDGPDYAAGDPFPLRYPVELKTAQGAVIETITELRFRRLKGADMTAIANASTKGHGEGVKCIVCLAAGITPQVYDRLDAADLTEVATIAGSFTQAGR